MLNLVAGGRNRGALRERCSELARRCGDLAPLREPIRQRLWEGNKAAVLAGKTFDGRPVAPLRPATLRRRKGTGPPRAPMGAASRVVTRYEVNVQAGPGRLTFTGSWPGFEPILGFLDRGTRKMVARPTMGFRPEDLDWVRGEMRGYVTGWRGWVARTFG